ncbi:MAG: response regulator [Anaerolineae bacterium]|jgi:CheY-like chemotaxis protein|nr:response regulator [Anaerolineae bacterium]
MYTVLYVEDDAYSREVLLMSSQMAPGFMDVTIYPDSENFEQKALLSGTAWDMILLDIHVRPITGFEMLKLIRQYPQFDNIPVVALTASVMNEEVQTLKEAGFDSILSKPIDLDNFTDMLARIMHGEKIWYVW